MTDEDFEQQERLSASKRRTQDREDFNHETGGVDVGRQERFGGNRDRKRLAEKEKRKHQSRLYMALMDAAYRTVYDGVLSALNGAEEAVYSTQLEAAEAVAATSAALDDARDQATTLPDGTKVFRAEDGSVYTEDGRKLDEEEAATIKWRDGSPSWEDYRALKQAYEQAKARYEQLARDNDRLAFIRARMEDEDNPPTEEELRAFNKEIDEIEARAEREVNSSVTMDVEPPKPEDVGDIDFGIFQPKNS